jgi:hypothetical protein
MKFSLSQISSPEEKRGLKDRPSPPENLLAGSLKIVIHRKGPGDLATSELANGIEGATHGEGPFFRGEIFDPRQETQPGGLFNEIATYFNPP